MSDCKNTYLPRNELDEIFALSCALHNADAAAYVCDVLSSECFDEVKHQIIFSEMKSLFFQDKKISLPALLEELRKKNLTKNAGGEDFVISLSRQYFSGCDYKFYCSELIRLKNLRSALRMGADIVATCKNEKLDPKEYLIKTADQLYEIFSESEVSCKTHTMQSIFDDFSNQMNFYDFMGWKIESKIRGLAPHSGVPTFYPRLDKALGFLQQGKLYYCGARASMGKSTFMLNLMMNILRSKKHKVGVFSLEMNRTDIFSRLVCLMAGVNHDRWGDGLIDLEEKENLKFYSESLKTQDSLFIEDPDSISIENLIFRAKKMKKVHGVQIIFIDYLTRIHTSSTFPTKHLEVNHISKSLQSLARNLDIPLFVFAQLSRSSAGNLPTLTDFRESGSIEEDADACLMLHRESYYDPSKSSEPIIFIRKNRLRGMLGEIDFKCNFSNSSRYEEKLF